LLVENTDLFIRPFALRDVANVALDRIQVAGVIHIGDKLHGNLAAIFRFQ